MNFFPLIQLIAISLIAHVALAGSRVTSALYALSLHASESTVGMLIALFAIFPMFMAMRTGRVIDRIGIRKPMLTGCLMLAAGCALSGIGMELKWVFLSAPLIGSGFLAVHIGSQHAVGALDTGATRAANFSWLSMGFSASSVIGPVMAGLLIDHAGFRTSFLVCLGFALLACGLIAGGGLDRFGKTAGEEATMEGAFDLLRAKEMRRIYFISILLAAAWDMFTFITPIRGTRLGYQASTIGLVLGSFAAATFLIRFAMPWISRRHSEWRVLSAALICAALCYIVFPLAEHPVAMMALAACLGAALGCSQPNVLSLLHQTAPPGRVGEAIGIRATVSNASQVVLPLAFGAAGAALGMHAVLWAVGAIVATGIWPALRQARMPARLHGADAKQ